MERSKHLKGINKTRARLAIAVLAAATVTGRAAETTGPPVSAQDTSHASLFEREENI